jgi:ABC-type multidrug transport system ATPase subunit
MSKKDQKNPYMRMNDSERERLLAEDTTEGMEEDGSVLDRNTMAIPNFKLSWNNVEYSIKLEGAAKDALPQGESKKRILKSVSGWARNNETLFIMGSSGAGKTTLLNALCDRIEESKNAKLTGTVQINEVKDVKKKDFGRYGAYVMQDDVLFETLTTRESLLFAARLRLNKREEIV